MSYAETLIERDLLELLGGDAPPDLVELTLSRLAAGGADPTDHTAPPAAKPAGRLITLRRLAEAAVVILAVAVIGWLVTRPPALPPGVTAARADYTVHEDHVALTDGWMLLTEGAPEVRHAGSRVHDVTGRAVVGGLELPDARTLGEVANELNLTEKEKPMFTNPKRWMRAAGLTLCLFTGTAMIDGVMFTAQDPDTKVDSPNPGESAKVGALLRTSTSIKVNRYGRILTISDATEIKDITTKLTGDGFKSSDKDLSSNDPYDWVTFVLPDGGKAVAVGLSQGTDCEPGYFDLMLPGWEGHHAYTIPAAALPVFEKLYERAMKEPKAVVSPEPHHVAKVKEMLDTATTSTVRTYDKDQWGGWLQFDAAKTVPLRDAIRDAIKAPAEKAAGWNHMNEVRLALKDGGVIEASVYTYGNLVNLKLPGWERSVDYTCSESLRQTMWAMMFLATDGPYAKGFEVKRKWAGADSTIKERRCEIVTTDEAWVKLWLEHTAPEVVGGKAAPNVDFGKDMVVAVFGGEIWNSRGYYMYETLQGDSAWTIRVDQYRYQTVGPDGGGEVVYPFGIFVVPRTDRSVVIEEDTQGMIGEPPRWLAIGGRVALITDPPKPMVEYNADETVQGSWGQDEAGRETKLDTFTLITDQKGWEQTRPLVKDDAINKLRPDFDKQVVVVAVVMAPKGVGQHRLQFVGRNAARTVIRHIAPTAQTSGEAQQVEFIYSVWVLPRPSTGLMIEQPQYRRLDQSPYWNEKYGFKSR